jgi:large subunit ribosomal protein L10
MTKTEKQQEIEDLKKMFSEATNFYVTDTSGLTVHEVNALRRLCYGEGIRMRVAKNTLIYKALEVTNKQEELEPALRGQSALLFSDTANAPARILKKFRKDKPKPSLKGAYIDTSIYIGDDQLETLATLKSKNELIGDIVGLLQSPAKNVLGALLSGKSKLAGIVKTLSEREEK